MPIDVDKNDRHGNKMHSLSSAGGDKDNRQEAEGCQHGEDLQGDQNTKDAETSERHQALPGLFAPK